MAHCKPSTIISRVNRRFHSRLHSIHNHYHQSPLNSISYRYLCTRAPPQKLTTTQSFDEIGHSKIDYNAVYKERTGVTSGLWRLRLNMTANTTFDPNNLPKRAELVEKAPWQSTIVILYDFKDNPSLCNEYIRFDGGVRLERILEDMDSVAGNVAEVHANNSDGYPLSFVTAAVDRIDMKRRFPMSKNLIMEGMPIHVGKSSVNIQITIMDKNDRNIVICTGMLLCCVIICDFWRVY